MAPFWVCLQGDQKPPFWGVPYRNNKNTYGSGSKHRYQHGTLLSGNMDHLRKFSCSILSHGHMHSIPNPLGSGIGNFHRGPNKGPGSLGHLQLVLGECGWHDAQMPRFPWGKKKRIGTLVLWVEFEGTPLPKTMGKKGTTGQRRIPLK